MCSKRIQKHWLTGPKAGSTEILIDAIPGFPDGIARASDGSFWVALIVPDSRFQEFISTNGRITRWIASWILQIYRPPMKKWGAMIKVGL